MVDVQTVSMEHLDRSLLRGRILFGSQAFVHVERIEIQIHSLCMTYKRGGAHMNKNLLQSYLGLTTTHQPQCNKVQSSNKLT